MGNQVSLESVPDKEEIQCLQSVELSLNAAETRMEESFNGKIKKINAESEDKDSLAKAFTRKRKGGVVESEMQDEASGGGVSCFVAGVDVDLNTETNTDDKTSKCQSDAGSKERESVQKAHRDKKAKKSKLNLSKQKKLEEGPQKSLTAYLNPQSHVGGNPVFSKECCEKDSFGKVNSEAKMKERNNVEKEDSRKKKEKEKIEELPIISETNARAVRRKNSSNAVAQVKLTSFLTANTAGNSVGDISVEKGEGITRVHSPCEKKTRLVSKKLVNEKEICDLPDTRPSCDKTNFENVLNEKTLSKKQKRTRMKLSKKRAKEEGQQSSVTSFLDTCNSKEEKPSEVSNEKCENRADGEVHGDSEKMEAYEGKDFQTKAGADKEEEVGELEKESEKEKQLSVEPSAKVKSKHAIDKPIKVHPFFNMQQHRQRAVAKRKAEDCCGKEPDEPEVIDVTTIPSMFLTKEQRELKSEKNLKVSAEKSRQSDIEYAEGLKHLKTVIPIHKLLTSVENPDVSALKKINLMDNPSFCEAPYPNKSCSHVLNETKVDNVIKIEKLSFPFPLKPGYDHKTYNMPLEFSRQRFATFCSSKRDIIELKDSPPPVTVSPEEYLTSLFCKYPHFPKSKIESIYKSYAYKSKTRNGVEFGAWLDKYQPLCSKEVLGNSQPMSSFYDWLSRWDDEGNCEDMFSKKKQKIKKSVFYDSDDDNDDWMDSSLKGKRYRHEGDSARESTVKTGAFLHGPRGSGKTAAVYACAKELGFKVFEINASSKRSGKAITSLFGEATQSHLVQKDQATVSFKKSNGKKKKKGKRKRFVESEDEDLLSVSSFGSEGLDYINNRKSVAKSLILFEEADIIFEEEDRGFWNGVIGLLKSTKRPIVLTAENENCMENVEDYCSPFAFNYASEEDIALHLHILLFVEGVMGYKEDLLNLIRHFQCDLRRILNEIQIWAPGDEAQESSSCKATTSSRKFHRENIPLKHEGKGVCDDDGGGSNSSECSPWFKQRLEVTPFSFYSRITGLSCLNEIGANPKDGLSFKQAIDYLNCAIYSKSQGLFGTYVDSGLFNGLYCVGSTEANPTAETLPDYMSALDTFSMMDTLQPIATVQEDTTLFYDDILKSEASDMGLRELCSVAKILSVGQLKANVEKQSTATFGKYPFLVSIRGTDVIASNAQNILNVMGFVQLRCRALEDATEEQFSLLRTLGVIEELCRLKRSVCHGRSSRRRQNYLRDLQISSNQKVFLQKCSISHLLLETMVQKVNAELIAHAQQSGNSDPALLEIPQEMYNTSSLTRMTQC
eukprot:Nk52_evm12s2171 gene=Nk52_evmTU12s2171